MSYKLRSPVTITKDSPVQLRFEDTVNGYWDAKTDLSGDFSIGNVSNPSSFKIKTNGTVQTNTENTALLEVRGTTNKVGIQADPSSDYLIDLPTVAPTQGQSAVYTGTKFDWDVVYNQIQQVAMVMKNPNPNNQYEFASIDDALNGITALFGAPSTTNRISIHVYTGNYSEPPLSIPSGVFIVGESMEGVVVVPSSPGDFIMLHETSGLAFMTINDCLDPYVALTFHNSGDYSLIHKIEFNNCPNAIKVYTDSAATKDSLVYIEYAGTTDSTNYTVYGTDDGLTTFNTYISMENFFTNNSIVGTKAVITDTPRIEVLAQSCVLAGFSGLGYGFYIENGSSCDLRGVYISGMGVAVSLPNDSGSPTLMMSAMVFEDCGIEIDVSNVNATGHYDGYSQYDKTIIAQQSSFFITNKDRNIITVAGKGGDFTSILDAVNAALAQIPSSTNRFTIFVGPGIYTENNPITVPQHISVVGFSSSQCVVIPQNLAQDLFVMDGKTQIQNLMLRGSIDGSAALIKFNGSSDGSLCTVDNITFDGAYICIDVNTSSVTNSFISNISIVRCFFTGTSPIKYGIRARDDGVHKARIYISQCSWTPSTWLVTRLSTTYSTGTVSQAGTTVTGAGTTFNPSMVGGMIVNGSTITYIVGYVSPTQLVGYPSQTVASGSYIAYYNGTSGFDTFVDVQSTIGIVLVFQDNIIGQSTIPFKYGKGCYFSGPGTMGVVTSTFGGFQSGCENTSGSVSIIMITCSFVANTMDIVINNTMATGSISATAAKSKITCTSTLIGLIISELDGSLIFTGQLYQGTDYSKITNITPQLQDSSNLGVISGGDISITSGLTIGVSAGTGYLKTGSPEYLKYVTWGVSTTTVTAAIATWLYIDSSGVLQKTPSTPDYYTTITIGRVKAGASAIEYIETTKQEAYHPVVAIDQITIRDTLGPIFQAASECIIQPNVTPGNTYSVDISGGTYTFASVVYSPVSVTNLPVTTPVLAYSSASTVGTSINTGFPLQWDNAGVLTALAAGQYTKHTVHLVMYGSTQVYLMLYGQTMYSGGTALADAKAGPQPTPPAFFDRGNIAPIAAIVVGGSDNTSLPVPSQQIVNICPSLSFVAGSSTSTNNHSLLTNLAADDHLQYFRTDGTRIMTGNIQVGNNIITGLNTATDNIIRTEAGTNSLNVFAHASRHASGGSDPIPAGGISNTQLANSSINVTSGTGITASASVALGGTLSIARNTSNSYEVNPSSLTTSSMFVIWNTTASVTLPNTVIGQIIYLRGATAGANVTVNAPATGSILLLDSTSVASILIGVNACVVLVYQGSNVWVEQGGPITDISTNKLSNKSLYDTSSAIVNGVDDTKRLLFDLSTSATSTDSYLILQNTASRSYYFPDATTTLLGKDNVEIITNKTMTSTTNNVTAKSIFSLTTAIDVAAATAPTTGQVLTATSSTAATWQTPATASINISTGTGLTGGPITGTGTISLSVPVSIANGGTNSTTALNNNRVMLSTAGAVQESGALLNGQLIIGSTGVAPVIGNISGTTNQISVTNGPGTITLAAPQNIDTGATPTFSSAILSSRDLVLGTTNPITVRGAASAASRIYTIPDISSNSSFAFISGTQSFTNKTITDATNTVRATQLATAGSDVIISAAAAPSTGQILTATSSTTATWQSPGAATAKIYLSAVTAAYTATNAFVSVGYIPWNNTAYSTYTTATVNFWHITGANRPLSVRVLNSAAGLLGSATTTLSTTSLVSFTITKPVTDNILNFQASYTGAGGAPSPQLLGVTLVLS